MYDLGSSVPLAVNTYDSTNTLANATAVVCTVTLPDGTTSTPAVTNPSAGLYNATFVTTQAGRHVVDWLATGTNASAYSDVFDVRLAAISSIISLADAKSYLGVTTSTDDDELRSLIASATHVIEHEVGACSRRTVVETVTGNWQQPYLQPRTQPIISVTSVTELGNTLVAGSDFLVDDFGTVTRVYGGGVSFPRGFWYGVNDIVITYVAGRTIIPSNILEAAKVIVGVHYAKRRGGVFSPFGDTNTVSPGGTTILGFYVPNEAMELLAPHRDIAQGIS